MSRRLLRSSCVAQREAASAALDGELTPAERVALDEHLEACAGCARHATRIARVSGLVRSLAEALA